MLAKVWAYFDAAEENYGLAWPRALPHQRGGPARDGASPRAARDPVADLRPPHGDGAVAQRLVHGLRGPGPGRRALGHLLPGAVRRDRRPRRTRGGCAVVQGARPGRRLQPGRPAARRGVGRSRGRRSAGGDPRRLRAAAGRAHRARPGGRAAPPAPRPRPRGRPPRDERVPRVRRPRGDLPRASISTRRWPVPTSRSGSRRCRTATSRGSPSCGRRSCSAATSRTSRTPTRTSWRPSTAWSLGDDWMRAVLWENGARLMGLQPGLHTPCQGTRRELTKF